MRLAFPTLGQVEQNGTAETLAQYQMRLHDKKATALIEVDMNRHGRIIQIFAHGSQAGAYHESEDSIHSTQIASALTEWKGGPIRVVMLEDPLARAAWLSCESNHGSAISGRDQNDWSNHLRNWNLEGLNGLVDLSSESTQGFLLFHKGQIMESESAWFSAGTAIPVKEGTLLHSWNALLLEPHRHAAAWKSVTLRRAANLWSRGVFESYQNIAGEKILRVMTRELQAQIRPWQWNIRVEEHGIQDSHFFSSAEHAAHAYRAIFMGAGAQMGFAIGSYLTQRILAEMYEELDDEYRACLESHRLIPAAFAE